MLNKIYLFFILIVMCSCSTHNLYTRNNNYQNDELLKPDSAFVYTVSKGDRLSLSIWNHDDLSVGSIYGIYNSNEVYGKWIQVKKNGYASFPKLGEVYIHGLNVEEIEFLLVNLYSEYLVDPVLNIKVHGLSVSVLGEVNLAGNYELYEGSATLLEVISMAEGFTFYAHKKKISLQRGDKTYLMDLTSPNSIDLYSLKVIPGDVIYIPQRGGKTVDKKASNLIALSSMITTIVLIISLSE